jgi:hypothetical protein
METDVANAIPAIVPLADCAALAAAYNRYMHFTGVWSPCHGSSSPEQIAADRATYPNLLKFTENGLPSLSDERCAEFMSAVSGFPFDLCLAWDAVEFENEHGDWDEFLTTAQKAAISADKRAISVALEVKLSKLSSLEESLTQQLANSRQQIEALRTRPSRITKRQKAQTFDDKYTDGWRLVYALIGYAPDGRVLAEFGVTEKTIDDVVERLTKPAAAKTRTKLGRFLADIESIGADCYLWQLESQYGDLDDAGFVKDWWKLAGLTAGVTFPQRGYTEYDDSKDRYWRQWPDFETVVQHGLRVR